MTEVVSQRLLDTAPIQIMSMKKMESYFVLHATPVIPLSAARESNFSETFPGPGFFAFVTAVTERVATRLAQEKLSLDNAESQERSLLQFMSVPVSLHVPYRLGDASPTLLPSLEARPSGGCRISSPWIDLAIERGPVPWVRGIVRWNQRQLLSDQAVLAGARNVPPGVPMPLLGREFFQYANEYADSEINGLPALKPVEERVPPDLLWLFRNAWQSTRGPFNGEAHRAMKRAMEKGAEGYTMIVLALIDRCLAADNGADIHFSGIMDVADLLQLESYKLAAPLR